MTDLHRLGHGLSYIETKFIKDKWVEWSEKQSKLVAKTLERVFLLHLLLIILTGRTKH